MNFCFNQSGERLKREPAAAFTLIEIVIALAIFGVVMSGLIYGYVQANRTSEWSSMSLAAQSFASQGAEQMRAADWRPRDYPVQQGQGTMDELVLTPSGAATNGNMNWPPIVDVMDIPTKGNPSAADFQFWVTNYINVTNISINPPLREIRSYAVWTFPRGGSYIPYTNWVILDRAGDQ
jgi:prepilin-type N-terminal cleavage/methylation domain-containing protein